MRSPKEYTLDLPDGTWWGFKWSPHNASFFAQRWMDDADPEVELINCPGPESGLYDDLRALKIAIGVPMPEGLEKGLRLDREANPPPPDVLAEWGRSSATTVIRATPDGKLIETYGLTGAVDTGWLDDLCCGGSLRSHGTAEEPA